VARATVIEFNATLQRHIEYSSAPEDLQVKQATMTLLPFPLQFPMSAEVQKNDLLYEAAHIGGEGPAMTHSILAIGWLALGDLENGAVEFERSYQANILPPFSVWSECPIPPDNCQGHRPADNFLTAAGGFVQALLYGYGGIRFEADHLRILPRMPPNSTALVIRDLHYGDAALDISADNETTSLYVWSAGARALHVTDSVGDTHTLLPGVTTVLSAGELLVRFVDQL
jgi:hypothetical protein